MKALNAFLGGVYFYAATILTQYGFNSYFGIPSNLIEPSIRDNIVLFFVFSQGIIITLKTFSVWLWVGLLIIVLLIWASIALNILRGKLLAGIVGVLIISSLFLFHNFGTALAKNAKNFNVFSGDCVTKKENTRYIIPSFFQTYAIVVSINTENKLQDEFFLVQPLGPACSIKSEVIGNIIK